MNIETLPIDAVHEYDRNPRTINDAAIDAVAKSIQAFGFKVPILVDADGVIIAGHTRQVRGSVDRWLVGWIARAVGPVR